MAAFLSDEWLRSWAELAGQLPVRPGASARVARVVTGGPGGDVRYVEVFGDGRVVEVLTGDAAVAAAGSASAAGSGSSASGSAASAVGGGDGGVDVTLTATHDDAVAVVRGDLDITAAFMQGRIKVVGNMARLLAVLPVTQTASYREALARLAQRTDW